MNKTMPSNRASLILPSKRVKKQKTPNPYIKSRFNTTFKRSKKTEEQKTVLSKSECFCENTSELQFAH